MAKFPQSLGAAALARVEPAYQMLPAGTALARVYFSRGRHPLAWHEFRYVGPVNARWDHHLPNAAGEPVLQRRGIYYAARDAKTCLAEVFQGTRRIDRAYQSPWLAVFRTIRDVQVLDVTGDFATRMGASMAIHSGSRARARDWARDLYEAFPDAAGILYASSMHAGKPAIALTERALAPGPLFAAHPDFHRALADDVMLDVLKHAARELGYGLR